MCIYVCLSSGGYHLFASILVDLFKILHYSSRCIYQDLPVHIQKPSIAPLSVVWEIFRTLLCVIVGGKKLRFSLVSVSWNHSQLDDRFYEEAISDDNNHRACTCPRRQTTGRLSQMKRHTEQYEGSRGREIESNIAKVFVEFSKLAA